MMPEILIVSIILSMASAIQSVVGFGLAMLAVPLLLMAEIDLLASVFLVLSISFVSACLGVHRLRRDIQWRRAAGASVLRAIGVLPGYYVAVLTAQSSPATIKAAIGFAIGLGVFAQWRKLKRKEGSEPEDQDTEPSPTGAPLAFLGSGFLMGWLGMGGPPLIFWLLSGRQDPKVSRSFLYGVYIFTIPFQLVLMAFHTPTLLTQVLPLLALAIPVCLGISAVALTYGDRLNVDQLQKGSLVLLSLLALKALADWILHFL